MLSRTVFVLLKEIATSKSCVMAITCLSDCPLFPSFYYSAFKCGLHYPGILHVAHHYTRSEMRHWTLVHCQFPFCS